MVPGVRGFGGLNRLDVRLVLLLGLALLPVGLIAMGQTWRLLEEVDEQVDTTLLGQSLAASAEERRLINRTVGFAQSLAQLVPELTGDPALCNEQMERIVADSPAIVFAGFTDATGVVRCASRDVGAQVVDRDTAAGFAAAGGPLVTVSQRTPLTQTAAVLIRQPVIVDAAPIGYVTITLPYRDFSLTGEDNPVVMPMDVLLFDAAGTPLYSELNDGFRETRLPVNRSLAAMGDNDGFVFRDADGTGAERIYSVVPLVPGQIFALGVWQADALRMGAGSYAAALAFPMLMWLVSLTVAYVAVHRLVIRHIRSLRRMMRTFAATRRIRPGDIPEGMPTELHDVIDAFTQLTEKVLRDEADQENMLHEKDVLLKEVHHRVKNNLQLISSITNMQVRRARHGETRFMLRRLQDRVLGLATVHRSLYQANVLSEVRADELISDLARQLARSATMPEVPIDFRLQTEKVLLYPDQAVPLSLLVTEAVTNAYKYLGRPEKGEPWVSLVLVRLDDGQVELNVSNSAGPPLTEPVETEVSGLGTQLIGAFVMQLGGTLETRTADPSRYEVVVRFHPADFTTDQ